MFDISELEGVEVVHFVVVAFSLGVVLLDRVVLVVRTISGVTVVILVVFSFAIVVFNTTGIEGFIGVVVFEMVVVEVLWAILVKMGLL